MAARPNFIKIHLIFRSMERTDESERNRGCHMAYKKVKRCGNLSAICKIDEAGNEGGWKQIWPLPFL